MSENPFIHGVSVHWRLAVLAFALPFPVLQDNTVGERMCYLLHGQQLAVHKNYTQAGICALLLRCISSLLRLKEVNNNNRICNKCSITFVIPRRLRLYTNQL